MMKPLIILSLLLTILFISGCSDPTPEELAKKSCDCYKEAKSKNNPDNQINETEKCNNQVEYYLSLLDDIGKKNDWTTQQIHDARNRFDNVLNNCNK